MLKCVVESYSLVLIGLCSSNAYSLTGYLVVYLFLWVLDILHNKLTLVIRSVFLIHGHICTNIVVKEADKCKINLMKNVFIANDFHHLLITIIILQL